MLVPKIIESLICPRLNEARKKYIKKVLVQSQSALSFYNLMNVKSTIQLANVCKYSQILKGLAQAKIIKKSVILFRVLNMTI